MLNKFLSLSFCSIIFIAFGVACQSKQQDKTQTTSTATTAATQVPAGDPYLYAPHQMGFAKFGMTKADLLKFYPNVKADTLRLEAEVPCWNIYDTDGKLLFQAGRSEEGRDTVSFFLSLNPKMHSAKGNKIGSSYEALQAEFPDIELGMAEGLRAYSAATRIGFGVMGDVDFDEDKDGIMKAKKTPTPKVSVETIEIY